MNASLASRIRAAQLMRLLLMLIVTLACGVPAAASYSYQQAQDDAAQASDDRRATADERRRVLATLLSAAQEARIAGEALKAARLTNRAGRLQLLLNLPQDALSTFKQTLSSLKQSADANANVDSLNGIGAAYTHLSRCEQAKDSLRQAIVLSEQNGYIAGKAEALLNLSDCQNHEDHALALRTAQDSLALWQSINHKWGIAKSYAAIGQYQMVQNYLTESSESFEAALALWRELNLVAEQAEALINMGFIEYRKGAWENSLSLLTEAQALLDEKSEPFKIGQITAGIGEAFIESGMPEIGLEKLQQSLEYFRQAQHPRSVMIITWDIGRTHYLLGNYTEAVAKLQESLAEAVSAGDPFLEAMCHEFLGRTYASMLERTSALEHFRSALSLYAKTQNRFEAARTDAFMGQVYQQEGDAERARAYYKEALGTFGELTDYVNQSATLYALGSLELGQNNLGAAEEYLRQSIDVTENIRRTSKSTDLTAAFSATVYERYEKYIECLMRRYEAQPSSGMDVRAFETSESARARSLAELLRATGINLVPGIDPQLAERERSLRLALRLKEDYKVQLLGKQYAKEELDALEAERARLEAEYKQVLETIRQRYPAFGEMNGDAAWSLPRIQQQLVADDQTVLLEYSLGTERSYVWAVTRDAVKSYQLPARDQITSAAGKVYKLLSKPPAAETAAELKSATRELGRMVLSPVSRQLQKRRVIVVADGVLNYIPFQVLPASAADEPLIAAHEVVNAPSASILGALGEEAARRRQATRVIAAFGDPVFASDYAERKEDKGGEQLASRQPVESRRLPNALRDIELNGDAFDPSVIHRLFYAGRELANLREAAGADALVATDFSASREQLLRTNLAQYEILHFATHAFLDPKHPENSGIVLSTVNREGKAQDGFVGLKDIYELRAPVNLVVLSACQTALGKEVRGEGLIGLTRGFMYAGASTVVASLWKVDDEATSELMKHFYTNMLEQGMTPSEALREAQNSIRQEPQWRSPYYWAAFTLQGEYREVIRRPQKAGALAAHTNLLLGVATLLGASLAASWFYRRSRLKKGRSYSTVKK